jgi:hypothetical protein
MIRPTDRQNEHGNGRQGHKQHLIMQLTDETTEVYAQRNHNKKCHGHACNEALQWHR